MGADCLGQTGKSILEAAVVLLLVAAADQAGPRQSLVVVQIRDSLVVDNSLLLVDILIKSGQRDVLISAVPWCRTTPHASTAPHTACHRRRSDVAYADMAAVRRVRRSSVGSVPCSAKDEESAAKCIFFSISIGRQDVSGPGKENSGFADAFERKRVRRSQSHCLGNNATMHKKEITQWGSAKADARYSLIGTL